MQQGTEPESRPNPVRRTLLTGGAVGLAAMAGAALGGAQPASAGTGPVNWLTPTGDPAKDGPAIQGALNSAGFALLAPDLVNNNQYAINTVINIPHKATLSGIGAETRVMCTGNAGFFMHDMTGGGNDRTQNSSGCIRDLIIDGTNASQYAIGLNIGDGWGYRLDHVFVENFTAPFATGILINNLNYFTEKMVATSVHVRNCSTHVWLVKGSGGQNSFEYNDLAFYFAMQPGQNGFVITNGAYMAGGSLMIRGNAYSQSTTAAQGYVITLGEGGGDGSFINSCRLDVVVELDNYAGGNSYTPGTINFADSSNVMSNVYGTLGFRDPHWTLSTLIPGAGQLAFRGILYGDTVLTSNVQVPPAWV